MPPDSAPLQYGLYDLALGHFLGHLPLNGVSFGSQLNAPGQLTGTIDLSDARVQALFPVGSTVPGRTVVTVDYEGSLVWAGIIWQRGYSFNGVNRVLTITASELLSYLGQRVQATDYSAPPYSGITGPSTKMAIWDATLTDALSVYDPLLIAWQLISDATTLVVDGNIFTGTGGLGIAANGYTSAASYLASSTNTPSTDYISQTYPYPSPQQILTMLSQLSSLGYNVGFDMAVDVAYSGAQFSAPIATCNLSYPRRGTTYAINNHVLNCGSAISYDIPEDGAQIGNTIYEQGSSGSLVVSQNLTPLGQGYPVLEALVSRSQIVSANILTVLQSLGVSDLYLRSYPVVTPTVSFDLFNSPLPLGGFIVGDNARWIIPATDGNGNVFDPRLPAGLDQEWRIIGYNAQVADEGVSTLQFLLALPPGTSAAGPSI